MLKHFFTSIILVAFSTTFSQTLHPQNGLIYDNSSVSRVDVLIDSDSLAFLLHPDSLESDHEYPADIIFKRGSVSDTVLHVGFRLRGNTSRFSAKKSYKIAINSFTSGRRYEGVKKLNINGEHNDPSISRARICWNLGEVLHLPVSRTAHTEVYINGIYMGVYINIEHINDDWLMLRYGDDGGNLYKCTWPADLNYISTNPNSYKLADSDGNRVYELQTNENADDYSDLATFIKVLNQSQTSQLECALDSIFDIEGYLKTLAFEVVTGHWDNYSYNKNNYYLYHNLATGKMEYIAYDMDNTFGVDWFNIDWATRNVLNWNNSSSNLPLSSKLLNLPQLKEIYKYYLREINQVIASQGFENMIDSIYNQIQPYASLDTVKSLDYGFTNADFRNSFDTTAAQQHVKKGLKTYIDQRVASTNTQLGSFDVAPIIRFPKIEFVGNPAEAKISAFVQDENISMVEGLYRINGQANQTIQLFDDGNHDDGNAGDGIFANKIGNLPIGKISFQVKATDNLNKIRTRPCTALEVFIPLVNELVINEFMADNDGLIMDQNGDYNDWIEIYNNSTDTIDLSGFFLTDNGSDPDQWQMPQVDINPHDFYLVWASGTTANGQNHSNFKLSKDGEEILIFKQNGSIFDTIDHIIFGGQSTDISFGRSMDAAPNWVFFNSPTPGSSNNFAGINDVKAELSSIYPNPFNSELIIENKSSVAMVVEIFSATGNLINKIKVSGYEIYVYNDHLPSGLRIIRINHDNSVIIKKITKF